MKNLSAALLIMFLFIIALLHVPAIAKTEYATGRSLLPGEDPRLDEKALKQLCDSLVLGNNFEAVIRICKPYRNDPAYSKTVIPYLIGAYYFTGDSVRSKNMLAHELKEREYLDIADYIINQNLALIKYFDVDHNREPVILLALQKYRNAVNGTRKPEGEQIIRFFINDQRMRNLRLIYVKESKASLDKLNLERVEKFNVQNADIYAFYKRHGRYFSEKEVGKSVSYLQPIFFSHIADTALRQTFFKSILEKAVVENTIDKETLVNFMLRTESFTNPDFWNTIIERLPEIRKQYGLSENYIYMPF